MQLRCANIHLFFFRLAERWNKIKKRETKEEWEGGRGAHSHHSGRVNTCCFVGIKEHGDKVKKWNNPRIKRHMRSAKGNKSIFINIIEPTCHRNDLWPFKRWHVLNLSFPGPLMSSAMKVTSCCYGFFFFLHRCLFTSSKLSCCLHLHRFERQIFCPAYCVYDNQRAVISHNSTAAQLHLPTWAHNPEKTTGLKHASVKNRYQP